MPTDYILFIHGVSNRSKSEQPYYADKLFKLLNGGKAHGSYWSSQEVAQSIAQTIKTAAKAANS